MSFFSDFFKSFLGFPDKGNPIDENNESMHMNSFPEDDVFGFRAFTSIFEKQFEEMFKTFHDFDQHSTFDQFHFLEPSMEFESDQPQNKNNLRDELFKPKFGQRGIAFPNHSTGKKEDSDIDESVSKADLGKILQEKSFQSLAVPEHSEPRSSIQSFGKSVVTKTIRRGDGFLEHHRTVKDSQGNEETTVTQQIGEQKYSVTTIISSNGEIQKSETFLNIDEGKLEEFQKMWKEHQLVQTPGSNTAIKFFDIDKFFKLF